MNLILKAFAALALVIVVGALFLAALAGWAIEDDELVDGGYACDEDDDELAQRAREAGL